MDANTLLLGVLFGSIGLGYIVYGRKQRKGMPLLSGVVLCAIPYFIPNIFLLVIISILLMALPFALKF